MIKERATTRVLTDVETGEAIELHEGDYIYRRNPRDSYFELISKMEPNEVKHIHLAGEYTKAYDFGMSMLANENSIKANEYRMILLLLPYIKPNSGLCEFKNHRSITLKWIADKMSMQQCSAKTILLSLKNRGIIHYGGSGQEKTIFMNPYLFFNGRYINKTLEDMFKKTKYYKAYMEQFKKTEDVSSKP